ncbi:MAG TPA: TonB-dependent receptor [Nevskiaceae bacterium]|nr:TonB-dependent receptor [Nevskiaceae bacterium]
MLTKKKMSAVVVLALAGTTAHAQEPVVEAPAGEPATVPVDAPEATTEAAPAEDEGRSRLVSEIIVTAQKREQNIQEVPIAISAFSPEMLDAVGVETAQDLERATPGLTVTNAAGYNVAYLRGVGTDAFLAGADPSVPFYLDGVALLGTQGSADTLGRVERVEVLKGPQGTLFGRNATGGAISIITPEPGDEAAGDLKIEYAKYDEIAGTGYVNIPLLSNFAVAVSAFYNLRDNYYENDYEGDNPDGGGVIDIYSRGFRAKARWDITDNFYVTPSHAYMESSNNAGLSFELTRPAPVLTAGGSNPAIGNDPKRDRHVNFDQLSGAQVNSHTTAVTSGLQTSLLDFKLIASDQRLDAPFVRSDFDKGPLPVVSFTSKKQIAKQKTAELQLLSNSDTPFADNFEWVGGLYYIESSGGFDPLQFTAAPGFLETLFDQVQLDQVPGLPDGQTLADALNDALAGLGLGPIADGVVLNSYGVSDAKSWSAYFQGTLTFTDQWDLTIGARYQKEDRDLKHAKLTADLPSGETTIRDDGGVDKDNAPPTLKATQVSPKVALQWRPTDAGQIYLSWARGYKSPTYNTVNFFNSPEAVDEEKVDSYEIGFKSDLLDGYLRLNGAAFYIKQKDLLTGFVALASGGVVTYDNAGDARIYGAEADFLWTPLPELDPGLVFTGAVTYLDTKYTDYKDGRGFDVPTGLAFGEGSLTRLPARDFTGNEIVRSPPLTYSVGVNQRIPFGGSAIEIGADVYYNDGFYFLPQNEDLYARESYTLVNARVSYFYDPWGLQFTVFGENVTDEEYDEVIFVDDFGRNQVLNAPRVFGVRMNYTF